MQFETAAFIVLTAIFGLLFGSFLNVCIFRIPKGESIVFGRSHCMSCGAKIKARDLVPVASFIVLRGRCRNCGERISARYPAVEALNAILWVVAAVIFGITPEAVVYMLFISGIIVISFIDIDTNLIPTGLVIYILIVGAVFCFFDNAVPFYDKLIGVAAGGAPLLLILLVSRGGMGLGDVEFAAAAGLLLGWKLMLLSLFLSFLAGGAFGAAAMLAKHKSGRTKIPFAPFLSLGMLIAALLGNGIINLYLSTFHLV